MPGQGVDIAERWKCRIDEEIATRDAAKKRDKEKQDLPDPGTILPVSDKVRTSSQSSQDKIGGRSNSAFVGQSHSTSLRRPPHGVSSQLSSTYKPSSDHFTRLEAQLQEEKRRRILAERELQQKIQKIAELEGKAQQAQDNQIQAIENDASGEAARWKRQYNMLIEAYKAAKAEKAELKEEIWKYEAAEDKLKKELQTAKREIENQRDRESAMGSHLGLAENDLATLGNKVDQLQIHRDTDIQREGKKTLSPDPEPAKQPAKGAHGRPRREKSDRVYKLVSTRDIRGDQKPCHKVTRSRDLTRREAFFLGG